MQQQKQPLSAPLLPQATPTPFSSSSPHLCAGCRSDETKRNQKGIPYLPLLSIWMVVLCAALPISSLFPFLYFMTRDFHISHIEKDIGFYAGFIGSSFMFGRALTSLLWGSIADTHGRKPVIILGILTVVIFNTLFGLSFNFSMALSTRFLLGALNGLLGPIKAYAVEIFPNSYQPLALSSVSTAWGLGLVIGPSLGGFLAQPCEKYPSVFKTTSIFCTFPYFLPCLTISSFAFLVLLASFFLPETLHNHPRSSSVENKNSFVKLLKNWELMSSVIVYCVFSLHDMAYTEVFSLWAVSRLGFSTEDVGVVLTVSGAGLLVFQMCLYPFAVGRMGCVEVTRVAGVVSVLVLGGYPFVGGLSGGWRWAAVNCLSVVKNSLSLGIITGLFMLQNNAVEQKQRGVANGISMTAMSIFKAVGPAGGGALFAWAQRRGKTAVLPGDHVVFFVLNLVEVLGLCMTFKPFLVTRSRGEEEEDEDRDG